MNQALETLSDRGLIKQCTDLEGLSARMDEGPVTFYVGFDPTGPSLHIGHLMPAFALAHLMRAGHQGICLLGGGTARIGDPTGKTEARRIMSVEEIDRNVERFRAQLNRFFGSLGVQALVRNNADWLGELNYIEFLRDVGRHFSVNRMLSFETYKARMETGLSFIEFNYQLLQSYDFYRLFADEGCVLQIGGDDQWGNIVAGVDLIRRMTEVKQNSDAWGLTQPLIMRADGKKMGKTESGALYVDPEMVSPYEFFQYFRNVPDPDVEPFLQMFTFLPLAETADIASGDVNAAKEWLAWEVTALIHGTEAADESRDAARAAFGGSGDDSAIPSVELEADLVAHGIGIIELFHASGLSASKGEARRLISQGGAVVAGERITDLEHVVPLAAFADGLRLRAGKKRHLIVRVAGS